jgi:hypothetical protein
MGWVRRLETGYWRGDSILETGGMKIILVSGIRFEVSGFDCSISLKKNYYY